MGDGDVEVWMGFEGVFGVGWQYSKRAAMDTSFH